jgi:hypothetical protein
MKKLIYLSFFGLLSFLYSCSSQINIDPKTLEEITTSNQFTFMAERANPTKYVVTMDEMQSGGNYKGIKQISLRNFLLAEDKERL